MSLRKLNLAAMALIVAAASTAVAGLAHRSARAVDRVVHARVGSLAYEAYLPADYDTSGLSYPVLYFLHGLPAGGTAYQNIGWLEHALAQTGKPAILIAPQGSSNRDPDPEYLGMWETAIATYLPQRIDATYRTIASRDGRALIGVSAGGYGAMHLALAHLAEFSAVESWSGYFHPTDPTGAFPRDLGSPSKNAAANVHGQFARIEARLDKLPLYIAFYIGRDDPTGSFVAENEQLNQELSRAGVAHVFRLYPGGHQQSLWSAHATLWLTLALNHLSPAR